MREHPAENVGVILEKPARPTVLVEVVDAVPTSTDLRLASVVHRAPSPIVEEYALTCTRFERKEVPQGGGQALKVSGALLIGEQDTDDQLPIVAAAGAWLWTVAAVRSSHGLSSSEPEGSVDKELLFVGGELLELLHRL